MAKKAAYVVFRGKTPGIYYSWDECNSQVHGVSGAEFKGYHSRNEAQRAWDEKQGFTFLPEQNSSSIRKRSDSDDGDALAGELRPGGKVPRLQSMEIPDSEEDIGSGDEILSEKEMRMLYSAEIPDSEDDISSDEDWHSSISQMGDDTSTIKAELEKSSSGLSFVERMAAKFGYREGQVLGKDEQGRKIITDVAPMPNYAAGLGPTKDNSTIVPEAPKPWEREPQFSLTAAQQAVVTMAEAGHNIFLTGAAGSGKTATLREILRRLEDKYKSENRRYPAVQVTAPTGIAALPLQGKTTWSFAGWNTSSFHQTWEDLIKDIKKPIKKSIRALKVLIIDEISMVENQFLERLNKHMQYILQSPLPFGGKQVIVVGDFHQLPPVQPFQNCIECGEPMEVNMHGPVCVTRWCSLSDSPAATKWEDKWAFKSPVWKQLRLKHVKLEQIHRQKDTRFQSTLNKIRNGIPLTDEEWKELEVRKDLPQGVVPVRLMSRVAKVRAFNSAQLAALTTDKISWTAQDICRKESQTEADRTNPMLMESIAKKQQHWLSTLEQHRFQPHLTLKVGAKVLLLYNLSLERGLVNGSQGEVVGFANATNWPVKAPEGEDKEWRKVRVEEFQKLHPWRPIVRFANGCQTAIEPIAVESVRGRSDDRYIVCRTQIPLTLGWALSIHKSQGMTLEYVELSSKDIFESGQLYVGLSRATKLEGLTVTGFNRKLLDVDEDVLEFYKTAKWVDLGQSNRSVADDGGRFEVVKQEAEAGV